MISDDLKAEILALSYAAKPNEACGFIIGGNVVRGCQNSALDKKNFWRIGPDEYEAAEEAGEITHLWHSHGYVKPEPSPADKTCSESCGLPMVIVNVPGEQWGYYTPTGWIAPLLNRPFVHGVLDCWSAVRDYYAHPELRIWEGADREMKVELPDFERRDEWWKEKGATSLYLDKMKETGLFREVKTVKLHDLILIQLQSDVPNHAAVYLGDATIFHHVAERMSCIEPYVAHWGYYSHHTWSLVRYKDFD